MPAPKSPPQPVSMEVDQVLQQAITHHHAGQLHDAERLYRSILQVAPDHPDVNHNLGVLAMQIKQPIVGLPHLKAALEANPNQGQYWLSYVDGLIQVDQTDAALDVLTLGRQRGLQGDGVDLLEDRLKTTNRPLNLTPALEHREAGRYSEAAEWLNTWICSYPKSAEAYAHLAHVNSLNRQDELAWVALNAAMAIDHSLPVVQRNLARLLLKQQKFDDALKAALSTYQGDSRDPENQMVLATVLIAKNEDGKALPLIESSLQIRPRYAEAAGMRSILKSRMGDPVGALNDAELALSIKPHLTQLWPLVGSLRAQLNDVDGAIEALEKAVEQEQGNIAHMVALGDLKRRGGFVTAAIELLEKAVNLAPTNVGAWINLGTAYQQAKNIVQAKAAYARALAIEPDLAEVASNLGALAKEERSWEESLRYFHRALKIKPDFPEAYNNLGVVFRHLGRIGEAETSFRRAIEIKPDLVDALKNLANTLYDLRRSDEAESIYRQALYLDANDAETLRGLGNTLRALGRLSEAEDSCKAALLIKPNDSSIHFALGTIFKEMGNLEAAASHLKACLETDLADPLGAELLLAGLGHALMPPRASEAQLDKVYIKKAQTWDHGKTYFGHKLVAQTLRDVAHQTGLDILDAGCGTGLVGTLISDMANRLVGVDTSSAMLEKAKEKNIYDEIYNCDLVSFLAANPNSFDAITCAATLIHFGDLTPVFHEAAVALKNNGLFIITLFPNDSKDSDEDVIVSRNNDLAMGGCYAHSESYVRRVADSSGFEIGKLAYDIHEYHKKTIPITGLVVALRRRPRNRQG